LLSCSFVYQSLHKQAFACLFCALSLTGINAFNEDVVIDGKDRSRTAVNRTQNISHANMSDKAFERMCETGEVPDEDARLRKRKASKEDSAKKGKKSIVEEEDDEEEEEEAPRSDRKGRLSASVKSDVKTPASKSKSSASKRPQESNGDGDSDGDDEPIETRTTPSSGRRSKGK